MTNVVTKHKEEVTMPNIENLRGVAFKQREKLRVSKEQMLQRIEDSPFGPKGKELARQALENESYGAMGWLLWSVPPIIEYAKGSVIYDVDGKDYIDLLSGFSVSQFGNCQEELTKVIQDQATKLTHYFDLFHPERVKLGKKLREHSGISQDTKVVFGVTGSDGIELAVRAARYYTGRQYILVAHGDYHGVTYGTMGLTGKGGMQPYFYPVAPDPHVGQFYFPHEYRSRDEEYSGFGMESIRDLERALEGKETPWADGYSGICNVAAILVEPFQSSAGYYVTPKAYLQELRRICDKFGILLITDEIQAGLGRSGKLWAYQYSDIEPDMIVTSKALGGGLPISAVIAKSEILTEWGPGAHVSTQAGNVLACAAGNYVMDVVTDPAFLEEVNRIGDRFYEGWKVLQDKHPSIGYIDHMGLYLSIEYVKDRKTKEPAADFTTFVRDEGVAEGLAFEKGGYWHNRTQMIPALNMPDDVMDEAFRRFDRVLTKGEKLFGIG
jgi:4-aminobutyrate aminotransferase-like enzyme